MARVLVGGRNISLDDIVGVAVDHAVVVLDRPSLDEVQAAEPRAPPALIPVRGRANMCSTHDYVGL